MTAAASIFAKDFDFSIVYVDMSTPGSYIPAPSSTRPGSERPQPRLFASLWDLRSSFIEKNIFKTCLESCDSYRQINLSTDNTFFQKFYQYAIGDTLIAALI